ncbi:hypothetical protein MMC28_007589 [Mycoblastus sanguinarius]|nr:hypothetical protein [Mycoblastus sanguinarius]
MSQLHRLAIEITDRANGVFIWVRIVVDELIECYIDGSTISQLLRILSAIPEELQDLYRRVLSKIAVKYSLECYIMVQSVLCAKTPLTLTVLLSATDIALHGAIETMSSAGMVRRLGSRSRGLIETTGPNDQVQFLHQTVESFFEIRENATSMFRNLSHIPSEDGIVYILKLGIYVATQLSLNEICENEYKAILNDLLLYAAQSSSIPKTDFVKFLDRLLDNRYSENLDFQHLALDGLCILAGHYSSKKGGSNVLVHVTSTKSCDLNSRPYELLIVAASYGILSYVECKIAKGLPSGPPDRWPLLHSAIYSAFLPCWAPDPFGPLPDTPKLVRMLLEKGADPNLRYVEATALEVLVLSTDFQVTLLTPRAWAGIFETMKVLLSCGGDADATVYSKGVHRSLSSSLIKLMSASDEYALEMLRILLHYGADCNKTDSDGFRPLFFAIDRGNWPAAELLLKNGADPSDIGNGRNTLEPETCRDLESFYSRLQNMQPLLQSYSK